MEINRELIAQSIRLLLLRYPQFGSDIAAAQFEYRTDLKYHTAATDGKKIYFDPDYFVSLSDDDRVFLIAHELMHIKFAHVYRLLDKQGQKRDPEIWNEVTDAIINANLERDGFQIKEGYVNRPDALQYSAEELYDKIKQEKEEAKARGEKPDGQEQSPSASDTSPIGDDHSLWEEAFSKHQEAQQKTSSTESSSGGQANHTESEVTPELTADHMDERAAFSENRQVRQAIAERNLARKREELLRETMKQQTASSITVGPVGEARDGIDWKLLLRREIEKTETIWSQRRSIAENNYAYRLEEYEIDDEAETEVMIDVSGSVNIEMVKAFLRILKPLLKHSKLRVGCFNERFWGMVEIKTTRDIDHFQIPEGARGASAWTEDWDLAVRSFTKKQEINKIVFTDGWPGPGVMPKDDLRSINVLWLVYGNPNFKPCCGKVISIPTDQMAQFSYMMEQDDNERKRSR